MLKSQKVMPHLMVFLNKFMKELTKIQEEQWWKVIKLLEELCFQQIGEKLQIKIMKERIDQVPQMVKNGVIMLRNKRLKLELEEMELEQIKSEIRELENNQFRV
jgi:predicted transcriptional regulator